AAMDAVINWKRLALDKPAISQSKLAVALDKPESVSPWGTPKPNRTIAYGPLFKSDISRDVGNDPRSIAYGQSALTASSYHAPVDRISVQDATKHLVVDLIRSKEPIHAIVYHGQHSVVVGGVWATSDPLKNPSSITALEIWDPDFGAEPIQASQMAYVSLDNW